VDFDNSVNKSIFVTREPLGIREKAETKASKKELGKALKNITNSQKRIVFAKVENDDRSTVICKFIGIYRSDKKGSNSEDGKKLLRHL
tara:strand:- start:321 stop:584 length:264 start_codon:yes stop_codon:yes gene_type:complete